MAKFVCNGCGYVHEGDSAPEVCPICKAPASKFTKQDGSMSWAAEHVIGIAQGVSEDILADLRANFEGECSEVGMYLAMSRVAHREGYPEIGLYWEKAAYVQTVIKQMCRAFIHHILIYSEFTLMLRVVISPPSELMHHRVN